MTMRLWMRNLFSRRAARPIQKRPRFRPTLNALEPRNLLSGIVGDSLSDMRDELLMSPVGGRVHAGLPATSGPLGTGGSTAANVNTDTEPIAGPHNETSIAVDPTNSKHLIGSANDYQLIVNDDGSITETVYSRAHV